MRLQRDGVDPRFADPKLEARGVRLVPLAPEHLSGLRALELSTELAFRWRHAGAHTSPEQYAASSWNDLLCSFLVFNPADLSSPRGIVSAYQADHANGHCRVAAARFGPSERPALTVMRALVLLFDYLFAGWRFRKLYFEVPAYNLPQFRSAVGQVLVEEGRLNDYVYLNGEYWDWVFLALTRERWAETKSHFSRLTASS